MNLKEKRIIHIEPTTPAFTVNWNLGLRCNFDCMYCPAELHNLTDTDLTLKEMQDRWIQIFNKSYKPEQKYKIAFTGGEVTVNKDFLPFVQWLDSNYQQHIIECGITTNGSATKKYYTDIINIGITSFIALSLHSEFFNERKFFENVILLHELSKKLNKSVHVNVMDEYWNKDQIQKYTEFLSKRGIHHSVNRVIYTHKIREEIKVNPNSQRFDFNG